MEDSARPTRVRLTELLAALSLGTDLGLGQPMEHVLRQTFLAVGLARRMGLPPQEQATVYYVSLLAWIGCHVDAYEQAKWFGDDQAIKREIRHIDEGRLVDAAVFVVGNIGAGAPPIQRARLGLAFLGQGLRDLEAIAENHLQTADALAERLGLGEHVRAAVAQTFERWDGKGDPDGLRGDAVHLAARLVNLADVVEVFHRAGGVRAAVQVAVQRRGTQFDPALVDLFRAEAGVLFDELETVTGPGELLTIAPAGDTDLSGERLDRALEAVADYVDLKLPYTIGHSRGVADLAAGAGRLLRLSEADVSLVRRAGLVHDLGRLGVSNAVWDKRTPLSHGELERIRLHPYLTGRMLAIAPGLAALGAVAAQHHERLDGSGYPQGQRGDGLSTVARVLAAADAYRARREPRPHRPEATAEEAATHLRNEARAGRLDAVVVEAVLTAAGHQQRRRTSWPAGLTAREVEVLRLVASGLSHQEIAVRLVISRKTARNHIERVYAKIGASNRARASVFAMRHGLVLTDALEFEPSPVS